MVLKTVICTLECQQVVVLLLFVQGTIQRLFLWLMDTPKARMIGVMEETHGRSIIFVRMILICNYVSEPLKSFSAII